MQQWDYLAKLQLVNGSIRCFGKHATLSFIFPLFDSLKHNKRHNNYWVFDVFGGRSCRTWHQISAVHLITWANKDAHSQNSKISSELLVILNTEKKKTSLKRPSSRLINEANRLGWYWNLPAVDWWTAPSNINKSCLIFAKCHTEWDKCAAGRGRNKTQNHP